MPLLERSTTLTASASPDGIYVYTKTKQGRITQARNTITSKRLAAALRNKQDRVDQDILRHSVQWEEDVLELTCSPHSTLCGVAWDSYSQSIFYQDDKGSICEWRKLNDSNWVDFSTPLKGLRGTNIAVVHAANGNRIMLFYQGEDHCIYCCSAQLRQWGDPVRIAKATESTGIGATSWNDLEEVRLYFQDEGLSIREYSCSFTGKTALTRNLNFSLPLKTQEPIGDITAISLGVGSETNIRLYLQDAADNIIDYSWDGHQCHAGSLKEPCFPNADIIAVPRDIGDGIGFCVNVFWVGADQKLYQRVRIGSEWRDAYAIMEVSDVGTFAGSLNGTRFSDVYEEQGDCYVRAVNVRVLDRKTISAIGFEYVKGSGMSMHGGESGDTKRFELEDKEDITYMSVVTSSDLKSIQGLRFGTSNGRNSDWYGLKDDSRNQLWSKSGHPLIGFAGAADDVVKGLRPLWATRTSTADVTRAPQLLREGVALDQAMRTARLDVKKLLNEAVTVENDPGYEVFKGPVEQIIVLTGSLEYLNDLTRRTYLEHIERRQKEAQLQYEICAKEAINVERAFQHAVLQSKERQERRQKLTEEANKILLIFDQHTKRLEPLFIEINAVRNILETETAEHNTNYIIAAQYADKARTKKFKDEQQTRANNTRDELKTEYDAMREELDKIDQQIKILDVLRKGIALEETEIRADVRRVLDRLEDPSSSLGIYTQFSNHFSKTYANGNALDDLQGARDLARKLLKLVRLVFEEPSIREQVGRGKVKPDQLLGALTSVADVGN